MNKVYCTECRNHRNGVLPNPYLGGHPVAAKIDYSAHYCNLHIILMETNKNALYRNKKKVYQANACYVNNKNNNCADFVPDSILKVIFYQLLEYFGILKN